MPLYTNGLAMADAESPLKIGHGNRCNLLRAIGIAGLLVLTACSRTPQSSRPVSGAGEWHEFQGTWIASGSRQTMHLGTDRRVSVADLTGTLMLAGPSRPAVGFRGEALVFNDSATGMVGRAVWTDDRGDQVYSELRGEGTASGNRVFGAFVGGTGRFAGATGTYEFSWRYVLENEDGNVAGESVGLKGRIRVGLEQATPNPGAPPS